jgi:hypothetical protein
LIRAYCGTILRGIFFTGYLRVYHSPPDLKRRVIDLSAKKGKDWSPAFGQRKPIPARIFAIRRAENSELNGPNTCMAVDFLALLAPSSPLSGVADDILAGGC